MRHRIVCLLALAAVAPLSVWARPPAAKKPSIDLRLHEATAAMVEPLATTTGALRIRFHVAERPTVRFPAPPAAPWDWSSHGFLVLKLRNPEPRVCEFTIRILNDGEGDPGSRGRTARGRLGPRQQASFAVSITQTDPMSLGMRGLPTLAGAHNLPSLGRESFDPRHVAEFQVHLDRPSEERVLEIHSAHLAPAAPADGFVDALGQYALADWPGKVHSVEELVHRHIVEAGELQDNPPPRDRTRFGGWRAGPRQAATGFFRTAKVDGKWWLVDPDGALFISLGMDVVTPGEATIITGREAMFTWLPEPDDPLSRHYGNVRSVHSGPVKAGKTFNFYAANLHRVYGPDYLAAWQESTLTRLRSWGFNTIGNWSDWRFHRNGIIPYVATIHLEGSHARVPSGSDYWGKMHDPFDPRFASSVDTSIRDAVARVKGDPWCLGYFVDNELSWGGFGDEEGRYGLALGTLGLKASDSPAKQAFLRRLKTQYRDVATLNQTWRTSFPDWTALEPGWRPDTPLTAWTDGFKEDLKSFVHELARAYFRTVRDRLQAADPDHLYLGCRFAWRTQEAIAAAEEFCDVVSFNIYERRVDPARWAFLADLARPVIIGEFHVGALDRGMFHTGLVAATDQEERAAVYSEYLASVLDHPSLVGAHWFQWIDEPLTGRALDGENYNIGFLTVTDTPYPEMVASARKIHREAYLRRAGGMPPNTRRQ